MKILIIPKDNKGAVLIISIIIGVVALAAGLTASNFVSRSTRNITDQESSIKALAIAESGVEKVLGATNVATFSAGCLLTQTTVDKESNLPSLGGAFYGAGNGNIPTTLALVKANLPNCFFEQDLNGDSNPDQSYYLEVASKGGTDIYTMDSLEKDSVLEINTKNTTSAISNVTISWEQESTANPKYSSILITEVYKDGTEYKVSKYAINPADGNADTGSGQSANGFTAKATFSSGKQISPVINLHANSEIIRIKPLYFDAKTIVVTADSGKTFPTANQGFDIYSTGCTCANVLDVSSRQNNSVRKVKVTKSREHLPAIFDYVLYSGSETVPLTK